MSNDVQTTAMLEDSLEDAAGSPSPLFLPASAGTPLPKAIPVEPRLPFAEIGRLGQQYYDENLREKLEPEFTGQFVFIDVETGCYVVNSSQELGYKDMRQCHPNALLYCMQIGYKFISRA